VTPDQIDELGHMNVRWYGHKAVAGTQALCDELGLGRPQLTSMYTRHHHEQLVGASLEVRSAVLGGSDRLRFYHELRNRADDDLAATFVHEFDHPLIEAPTIELPDHGRPRSIRLDADIWQAVPALAEVQAKDLAMRLPRDVTTEDSLGAETVPLWLTSNLLWGGERPDPDVDWIQTLPDGRRVAFATMETRVAPARPVPVGARIQSFGAVVATTDKVSHSVNWAFDLDTSEPVAVHETVNLAFDLEARRSCLIPDAWREGRGARFHPEYAVTTERSPAADRTGE